MMNRLWQLCVMVCVLPLGNATVLSVLTNVLKNEHFPDEVLKLAIDSCDALPLELILSRIVEEPKHVRLNVFTPRSRKIYKVQDVRRLLIENPKLNSFRPTIIYVHGWRNNPLDESSQTIVKALLTTDANVIVFDSSKYLNDLYISASSHVFKLGLILSKFIMKLAEKVPVKRINLIGFSLGAHIAGVAGKMFHQQTGKNLERITALDPAKPCFERLEDDRLSKYDAKYVDVYHSNSGTLGLREAVGHADYYLNGVSGNQPECQRMLIRLECNHAQAWKVFAAAVEHRGALATQCSCWERLASDQCDGTPFVLGYEPATVKGLFYVRTKSYSKNQRGLGARNKRSSIIRNVLYWG